MIRMKVDLNEHYRAGDEAPAAMAAKLVKVGLAEEVKPSRSNGLTVETYVDGYMDGKWRGKRVPKYVEQFAANNAEEIEAEFQRRAKVACEADLDDNPDDLEITLHKEAGDDESR